MKVKDKEDLITRFDEMGYAPTTLCPDPEAEAKDFKQKLIKLSVEHSFGEICRVLLYQICENYNIDINTFKDDFKHQEIFERFKEWLKND